MKKYLILFSLILLACAGTRENKYLLQQPNSKNKFVVYDDNPQRFDVRATIVFPRMTFQQAGELETKLRNLFPDAQEINLNLLGDDFEIKVDSVKLEIY